MQRKLTIMMDAPVYERLHEVVGRGRIGRFIEDLVRPHVSRRHLDASYRAMAAHEQREADALAWAEATVEDADDAAPRGSTRPAPTAP